ncbi:MAG: BatD family protein [Brumimicrobium sp.]
MRYLLLHIILLSCTPIWCQDEFLQLEINPSRVEKGQDVTITIKTNIEGRTADFELPDEFTQSGPTHSGMSSSVNYSNGKGQVERFSFQKLSGYFDKEGEYKIGPVKVQTSSGQIESNTVNVKVVKSQNMISADPSDNMDQAVFGIIEQSHKEIYEGQPLVLEGKVYAQIDILQVENYHNFKFEGSAEEKSLANSNQVSRKYEKVNGKDVMTFKIGKSLVFPDRTGTYEISPFEIILLYDDPRQLFPERVKVRSNESKVKVKPLPSGTPKSFIGGVGNFNISASLSKNKVEQGKVVELNVHIFGHGNLHNIDAPRINLPKGMVLYGDPEEKDSMNFSSVGAEGMKTFTYFIQANKAGDVKLNPIEIAFFDVEREKYKTIKTEVEQLNVEASENFVATPEKSNDDKDSDEDSLMPYITSRSMSGNNNISFDGWSGTILFTSPLLLGLFFGFVVRYKRKDAEEKELTLSKLNAFNETKEKIKSINELNSTEEKVNMLHTSLLNLFAKKWDVNTGDISRSFLALKVKEGILDESVKNKIVDVLNQIDQLRYGISGENIELSKLKNESFKIIEALEK